MLLQEKIVPPPLRNLQNLREKLILGVARQNILKKDHAAHQKLLQLLQIDD